MKNHIIQPNGKLVLTTKGKELSLKQDFGITLSISYRDNEKLIMKAVEIINGNVIFETITKSVTDLNNIQLFFINKVEDNQTLIHKYLEGIIINEIYDTALTKSINKLIK